MNLARMMTVTMEARTNQKTNSRKTSSSGKMSRKEGKKE